MQLTGWSDGATDVGQRRGMRYIVYEAPTKRANQLGVASLSVKPTDWRRLSQK